MRSERITKDEAPLGGKQNKNNVVYDYYGHKRLTHQQFKFGCYFLLFCIQIDLYSVQ